MERTMTATNARIHFGEVLRQVAQGNRIIVKRIGRPQAVILSPTEYNRLQVRQQQEDWKTLVKKARDQIRSELGERELTPADEVIRQMREERDEQLLDLR